MRRIIVLTGVLVAAVLASVAFAASPHYVGTPSAAIQGNDLVVSFKAAGLGNLTYADFTLTGTVNVSSRCYNRGGNKPQADNKQETISVSQSGSFAVTRNGSVTGSFTVTPLSTLTCPGNQVVRIESASWDLDLDGAAGHADIVGP